jgi:hypothetical protein
LSSLDDVDILNGGNVLDEVSTTNGAMTPVGAPFANENYHVKSIDFDGNGAMWGIGPLRSQGFFVETGHVYTLDPTTGVATLGPKLSAPSSFTMAVGLAVAPPSCPVPPPPLDLQPNFTG